METDTNQTRTRGEAGRIKALATFARRRAERAQRELESQGYTVIAPDADRVNADQ